MPLLNKLISVAAVLIYLAGSAAAESNGFVFDWEPFVAKKYLALNPSGNDMLPENLSVYQEIRGQFAGADELLPDDFKTINVSSEANINKSILSNIKITFSPTNSFMIPLDEISSRGKEGKVSRAARTFPSLLRNPSQEAALETLKLIEPQVNLGFEF